MRIEHLVQIASIILNGGAPTFTNRYTHSAVLRAIRDVERGTINASPHRRHPLRWNQRRRCLMQTHLVRFCRPPSHATHATRSSVSIHIDRFASCSPRAERAATMRERRTHTQYVQRLEKNIQYIFSHMHALAASRLYLMCECVCVCMPACV